MVKTAANCGFDESSNADCSSNNPSARSNFSSGLIDHRRRGGAEAAADDVAALFCFIKKRKKTIVQETDNVKIEEHVRVHEDIVPGPHGTQAVVLTIDEDLHVEEEIHKTSEVVKSKGSHLSSQAPEIGESTSIFKHHHNLKE
ncbi:hypothetical protein SASPL_141950 [Salvia splendens]|uniref:Uncharacterized protein n=1 Tax=Salvia splendens TaxID=180675 RepID=A0A8X8WL10_SALSN|nr:hypothetical protein SASPL_141950 [Salvia splendens]